MSDPITCSNGPSPPVTCHAASCPAGWFANSQSADCTWIDNGKSPGYFGPLACRRSCKYSFPGEPEPNPFTEDSVDGNYTFVSGQPPTAPTPPLNKNNALYGFVYNKAGGSNTCPPGYKYIGQCGGVSGEDCHNYTNSGQSDTLARHFRICQRDWESLDVNADDCCAGANNKQFTTGDCRPFAVPSSNYCLRRMSTYIDSNPSSDALWTSGKEDTVNSYINYTSNPSAQMKTNQHLLISQLIKEKGGYGFKELSQGALKNLVGICNQFPGACDESLDQYCSLFDRETLSKYATSSDPKKNYIAQLCGCHLPTKEYLGYKQVLAGESPECDPICMNVITDGAAGTTGASGAAAIGPSVPRGYETVNNSVTPPTSRWTTKQCNQAICIIDGANINMNTNIGGDINFTNICDRSSGGASGPSGGGPIPISSQCVFSSAGITDAQLTAMSTVDFTKTCKGECYVMVRGKKTPVDCVGSEVVKELRAAGGGGSGGGSGGGGGDDGGGGGTLKKWSFMWIISIALLVLFLFLAIGLTFFAPKS